MARNLYGPLETPSLRHLNRICYSCNQAYPQKIRFCPQDGVDLDCAMPPIEDLARDFGPGSRSRTVFLILLALAVLLLVFFRVDRLFRSSSPAPSEKPLRSGELLVRTTPPGATLYLDGSQVGITPVRLSEIPSGIHYLSAEFPGYKGQEARIEISPSSKRNLLLDLAPLHPRHFHPYVAELFVPPSDRSAQAGARAQSRGQG
jgi:hypothetical protein